jgi:acid stress-induced BolA-like protein IbaG/YrbA
MIPRKLEAFLGVGMNPQQVAQLIETGLGGSQALVNSEDNVHFDAVVIAPAFAGKRAVQRHQMVYSTLGAAVGNEIHALALQVFTPEEYAGRGRG